MLFKQTADRRASLQAALLLALCLLAGAVFGQGMEPPLKRPLGAGSESSSSPAASSVKPFRIAVHSWPPYAGRNLQYFGIAPRLVSEALAGSQWSAQFQFMHWSQALDKLAAGEVDAAIIWASSDMALDNFLISTPLMQHRAVLYYRKDSPRQGEVNNMRNLRLVWMPHYVYEHDTYRKLASKQLQAVAVSNEIDGFTQLLNQQADAFLLPQRLASSTWSKLDTSRQKQLAFHLQKTAFPSTYLLVNRQNTDAENFMQQFNSRLKKLQQTGKNLEITEF